jgi:hypothetical protein
MRSTKAQERVAQEFSANHYDVNLTTRQNRFGLLPRGDLTNCCNARTSVLVN